jgi:succinate dehydrogenase cytochrome b subunit
MGTTLPESVPAPDRPLDPAHIVRRVLSLCGLVPLGAFLVVHLAINASALAGSSAFARTAGWARDLPALPLVEWLLVFLPLLVHASLGLWLIVRRQPLHSPAPYAPGLRLAMRATAVGTLCFLAAHLSELRLRGSTDSRTPGVLATLLDAHLSSTRYGVPWVGVAYLLGAGCATFHFACGSWAAFAVSPAGQASERRRRLAAWASVALGIVMWAVFADVVVLRATGAAILAGPRPAPASSPCPIP